MTYSYGLDLDHGLTMAMLWNWITLELALLDDNQTLLLLELDADGMTSYGIDHELTVTLPWTWITLALVLLDDNQVMMLLGLADTRLLDNNKMDWTWLQHHSVALGCLALRVSQQERLRRPERCDDRYGHDVNGSNDGRSAKMPLEFHGWS